MADTTNEPEPEIESESEVAEEVKKGPGMMGIIKVVAFVSIMVLVEVVAASILLPSGHDIEQTARRLAAAEKGELSLDGEDAADAEVAKLATLDTREVDLGLFNVTRYNPATDKTLIIDFELFGVVLADDEGEFTTQYESNRIRLREQIIMILGAAESTDLTDANLGLLKRRILEKSNRALGRPLVQEVLFSKFNFAER